MSELDDHQLLAEFARCRSETAFTELVRRHAGLVYSTALRSCGNPQHAEEITQAVFIILARKAGTLSSRVMVSGWLYQAARLTAANFVKGEIRRRRREQEAVMQSTLTEPDAAAWETIAPLLDEAMGVLGETDRNAVLLRYFENRTSREIGAALRMNEETARKRVNRALEKLHHFFAKRGVTVSGAALSGALSAHSIQPVPTVMVKSICAVAAAKGATVSTSTLTLIKGALKIMAWTKAKTAVVAGAILILATGTTTVVIKHYSHHSLGEPPLTPANMASFQKESTKLVHDIKMATMACMLFAMDHRNQLPASFAQLNAWQQQTSLLDADWEFVAGGDKHSFTNPAKTIYVMEKEPRRSPDGKFVKVYATVDGRVFLITSPVEDFTAVEKQRGFLVQPAK